MDLLKYKNVAIVASGSAGSDCSELPVEYDELVRQLDSFEAEVEVLTSDLAAIDASIGEFQKEFDNAAMAVSSLGTSMANAFGNDNSSKLKGYAGMAALAIRGIGYLESAKKRRQAEADYQQKVDALMEEKQRVAQVKLPLVRRQLQKCESGVFAKFEQLYSSNFTSLVEIEDTLIVKKIAMFRKYLSFVVRTRFLSQTLGYLVAEMEAWQKGWHNSSYRKPSVAQILEAELLSWPKRLFGASMSWSEFITRELGKKKGHIYLASATVLGDPCLLRNFVGINLTMAATCPAALIDMPSTYGSIKNPLVLNNVYFRHCKRVNETYSMPSVPWRFNLWDLLVLLFLPAVFFGLLMLIFHIESSTLWRIFFMVPSLCWIALGIEYLETNYRRFFPYVKRLEAYNASCYRSRKAIMEAEDCREVHIIG